MLLLVQWGPCAAGCESGEMLLWALAVWFCELKVLSWGSVAVTLCHWIQSDTNTTKNSVSTSSQHGLQNCISTTWECSLGPETGPFYIKSFSQSICWSPVLLCVLAKCKHKGLTSLHAGHGGFLALLYCTAKLLHLSIQSVFHLESNAGRTTRSCPWLFFTMLALEKDCNCSKRI